MTALSRRAALAAAPVLLLLFAGCAPPAGKLKGRLMNGDQPVGSDGQQVSLSFHPVAGGTPNANTSYTAPLNADGSFEFVASGGTLPPGEYRVVIAGVTGPPLPGELPGKGKKKPSRFDGVDTLAASKLTATVTTGQNDIVLDLSKAK